MPFFDCSISGPSIIIFSLIRIKYPGRIISIIDSCPSKITMCQNILKRFLSRYILP